MPLLLEEHQLLQSCCFFPREVNKRVKADQRVLSLQQDISKSSSETSVKLRQELNALSQEIMLEKRGEVASGFDQIHSVQRAVEVGSLDRVIKAQNLRLRIVEELECLEEKQPSEEKSNLEDNIQ